MCSNHGEWAEPDPTTDEIRECHIWQSAYGSDGCHEGQDPHTHRGILLERLEQSDQLLTDSVNKHGKALQRAYKAESRIKELEAKLEEAADELKAILSQDD